MPMPCLCSCGAPDWHPERMRGVGGFVGSDGRIYGGTALVCTHQHWIRAPPPGRAGDLESWFSEIEGRGPADDHFSGMHLRRR